MKYKTIELTPESQRCGIGACPGIYEVKEVTPRDEKCVVGTCPSVFEVTPRDEKCVIGNCSRIYLGIENDYLIIGKVRNPKDFGLAKKVGEAEMLISVPKGIIDKLNKC